MYLSWNDISFHSHHKTVTNPRNNLRITSFMSIKQLRYPKQSLTKHGFPCYPFPLADVFWSNNSRWLFENIVAKGEIAHDEQFLFWSQYFQLYLTIKLNNLLWRFFKFLSLCFQSRLLQISCMWERVIHKHLVFLA